MNLNVIKKYVGRIKRENLGFCVMCEGIIPISKGINRHKDM